MDQNIYLTEWQNTTAKCPVSSQIRFVDHSECWKDGQNYENGKTLDKCFRNKLNKKLEVIASLIWGIFKLPHFAIVKFDQPQHLSFYDSLSCELVQI